MSAAVDLRELLRAWPYDPEDDARLLRGDDGREIIQVRTPLGIEQFEVDGRPDGERPHGMESSLEYYLNKLKGAKAAGKEPEFELDPADCVELFNEGTLYYFRYIRFFQLKDWERTVRDTTRNLRVFDFVHQYGSREEDRNFLEKWRPYIIRVSASAAAMLALESKGYHDALRTLTDAIDQIANLGALEDETFSFERERSITALRELIKQIETMRPRSKLELLEEQLRQAVEQQEFERAAELRDQIRALRGQPAA